MGSDSNWEDVKSEQELYPTLDVDNEDWADQFTNSIQRFHGQQCWNELDTTNIWEQFGITVVDVYSCRPGLALLRAILKISPNFLSSRHKYWKLVKFLPKINFHPQNTLIYELLLSKFCESHLCSLVVKEMPGLEKGGGGGQANLGNAMILRAFGTATPSLVKLGSLVSLRAVKIGHVGALVHSDIWRLSCSMGHHDVKCLYQS